MTRKITKVGPVGPASDESTKQQQHNSPDTTNQQSHHHHLNHLDHPQPALNPSTQTPNPTTTNTTTFPPLPPIPKSHIIKAGHGHAFHIKKGHKFRIIDLHGQPVVDLMAWTHPYTRTPSTQHSSMSYTRYRLGGSAPPQVGEYIYTNLDQPMLKLTADTVRTHDMLFMACNPSFYKRMGMEGHRNCAENISGAVNEAGLARGLDDDDDGKGGMKWNDVVDPFNVFQNTPYYSLKALGCSKAGDYVEFEACLDCVVGLSCCPFDGDGFNGGEVTDVAVWY